MSHWRKWFRAGSTLPMDQAVLVGIGFGAIAARLWLGPFAADDAYITFRYARNLAAGMGFTYNPPVHVLGTTTPLFTLLMAAPEAADWDPRWWALSISILSDLVTMWCGSLILRRHGLPFAALLYAAGLAFWPSYLSYATSGMETSLYVALLASAWLAVDRARPMAASAILAFATLCRPDALLACGVVFVWILGRRPRAALGCVLVFVAILLPWALFSVDYFGTIVPASIVARAHGRLPVAQSLLVFVTRFSDGHYLPMTALAAIGAACVLRRRADVFLAGAAWCILYSAAFITTGAFSFFPWYFAPLFPIYFATIGVAAEAVTRRIVPARAVPHVGRLLVVAAGILLASRLPHHRQTLRQWFDGRESQYERVATLQLAGTHCTLAATEIGTLGYFYDGPVLDLIGLVSPEVIGKPVLDVLRVERPCWVATYDDHIDAATLSTAEFRDRYDLAFWRRVGPEREFLLYKRNEHP